ncbi:MAG: SDR family NAD(P)-dependent oxidoreductase [Acidimicrobiales bacterium]
MPARVCIVTGASSGIGQRLATDLARDGDSVVLVARPSERLDAAVGEAGRHGTAAAEPCDVGDSAAVEAMVGRVAEAHGRIDMLVNAAGIEPIGTVSDTGTETLEETVRTNLLGTMWASKAVLPIMLRQSSGTIVNFSSSAGKFPLPRGAAYCATKAAIAAFSEALHHEVRSEGIHVMVVYPGFVPDSGMAKAHVVERGTPPRYVQQSLDQVSRAVRAAVGTGRLQLVLPRYLAWAPAVKELFPAAVLAQVARTQA